jgi:hypothetical protein
MVIETIMFRSESAASGALRQAGDHPGADRVRQETIAVRPWKHRHPEPRTCQAPTTRVPTTSRHADLGVGTPVACGRPDGSSVVNHQPWRRVGV